MGRIWALYDRLLEYVLAAMFATLVIITLAAVGFRYALRSPIVWAEEVGRYLFIWIIYLGSAVAFLKNSHIRVDYVESFLSVTGKKILATVIAVVVMAFLLFVLVLGTQYVSMNMSTPAYSTPVIRLGWAYLAIPIGTATMVLNLIRTLPQVWK